VREIRALMGEKADREAFQKGLLDSMRAHEERMIENTGGAASAAAAMSSKKVEEHTTDNGDCTVGDQVSLRIFSVDTCDTTSSNDEMNLGLFSIQCFEKPSDDDSTLQSPSFDHSETSKLILEHIPVLQLSPSRFSKNSKNSKKSKKSTLSQSDISPGNLDNEDEDLESIKSSTLAFTVPSNENNCSPISVSSDCSQSNVQSSEDATEKDLKSPKQRNNHQCSIS
jgi:hypothetical protein